MFELNLPVETLEVRGPLFAAGVVWLRLEGTDFPASGWHDSPLSVFGSLRTAVPTASPAPAPAPAPNTPRRVDLALTV